MAAEASVILAQAMERGESGGLEGEGDWPRRPFRRQRRANKFGMTAMALYLLALAFYLYIRIAKTLDLAQYTWCAASLCGPCA